ncbi:PhoH family protein [Aerococcaceae bacterium zg-B36]|nr:PhoH family protein [Aerococcaceae bacterium zg-B36]NEW63535.1 phosphate starvation-inducible protein PhoH [Facklamia sp. 252]NEW67006.1 phosphate starvation-inducible protein PhoH [Facklamia sp. 253]QQD66505.1 PhoH family protein [Aerococcaceae bacterium zg-252]
MIAVIGNQDQHLKMLESEYPVSLSVRGEMITITGQEEAVYDVRDILLMIVHLLERNISPKTMDIVTAIKMAKSNQLEFFINLYEEVIGRAADGRAIRAKNYGQLQYVKHINQHDITFGIGPAGTGKTFLAVVLAVQALREGKVKKIILTRPAVEAGESLGFLPGDLKEKVDPYLRPVYDALYTVLGTEQTNRLMDRGIIEIAPLAYMRGRTLDDAFVILDEAQNTTIAQMKMFLTRLGFGSKMIINGDQTQIDLPKGVKSGLIDATYKLKNIKQIAIVSFDAFDVVRHPVVGAIIQAYSKMNSIQEVTESTEDLEEIE